MEAKKSSIWIEQYRPDKLSEVVGNVDTIQKLRVGAQGGNLPNLLLAGPPGTGKTTSIQCLARELLGEHYKSAVMELNASDERGIDTVRDKIKGFAKEKKVLPPNRHKIIILDEVDSMTEVAQQALRRLMEVHSSTTRFALACNQSTKVIEPIQSRCAILRFSRITDEEMLKRLLYICHQENIVYDESGLEQLIFSAEGDMRNAINNLQSTVNGFNIVSKENVLKVCDMPPPDAVRTMIECCKSLQWGEAHQRAVGLIDEGYTPMDICGVIRNVLKKVELPEHVKLEYLKEASRCHYCMVECATIIQLDKLLANFCKISLQLNSQS